MGHRGTYFVVRDDHILLVRSLPNIPDSISPALLLGQLCLEE
jgi:hypothetical protein